MNYITCLQEGRRELTGLTDTHWNRVIDKAINPLCFSSQMELIETEEDPLSVIRTNTNCLFLSVCFACDREKLDFPDLSRLGHFLKGSSAALGLTKVKESCEKLQHYGNRKDAAGVASITNDEAETLIRALLVQMRREYNEAESYLKVFYDGQE